MKLILSPPPPKKKEKKEKCVQGLNLLHDFPLPASLNFAHSKKSKSCFGMQFPFFTSSITVCPLQRFVARA